jgi:hypothetical protein
MAHTAYDVYKRMYAYMKVRPLARMNMPVCGPHVMLTSFKGRRLAVRARNPFLACAGQISVDLPCIMHFHMLEPHCCSAVQELCKGVGTGTAVLDWYRGVPVCHQVVCLAMSGFS